MPYRWHLSSLVHSTIGHRVFADSLPPMLLAMNHDDQTHHVSTSADAESGRESAISDASLLATVAKQPQTSKSPWDDDDPSTPAAPDDPDRALTMRLLKPSLIALAVCTGVIFLSAVASNNAIRSSQLEQTSLAIHRLGMIGLLVSFFGILVSYRLPAVSRFLKGAGAESAANERVERLTAALRWLFLSNLMVGAIIWMIAYSGALLPIAFSQLVALISVGVLGNLAIVHRGIFQAYAIGAILPLAIVMINTHSMMMASIISHGMARNTAGQMLAWPFAAQITCVLVAGVVSAAIFALNEKAKQVRNKTVRDVGGE